MSEKKLLTFWQALFIGLGNIIGAGIFVMAGSTISVAGPGAIIAFIFTAILAMSIGLNSAELSSIFTDVEGGVYSFTLKTLGEMSGFLVGWFRVISYVIGGAATALGFSGYLLLFGLPKTLYYTLAVILIVILLVLDYFGIGTVAEVDTIFVIINISSLILFSLTIPIIVGIKVHNFVPLFPHGIQGVLTTSNLAFFSYSGFNTIVTLTPSTKNGEKVIPRAIVMSLIITSIIYISVIFSMVDAMPWYYYGQTSAPLSLALSQIHAPTWLFLITSISAILATISVTLSIIVASERTLRQLSRDFQLPVKHELLVVGGIMLASLLLGNVEAIALASNFGIIFSYMLTGLEVIIVRRKGLRGSFRSPAFPVIQVFAIILSALFMISLGLNSLEIGVVTLFIGILVYETLREVKAHENRKK